VTQLDRVGNEHARPPGSLIHINRNDITQRRAMIC
jgi:hypothetical protein